MNTIVKRNNETPQVRTWLNDFFDVENAFGNWLPTTGRSLPAVNISEDDNAYSLDVVAPGYTKDDFKISVEDDVLTISAENKKEPVNETNGSTTKYNRREYSYSSFTRSFRLPDNVKDDAIEALYKDGILKLTLAKSANPVKATKEIKIN